MLILRRVVNILYITDIGIKVNKRRCSMITRVMCVLYPKRRYCPEHTLPLIPGRLATSGLLRGVDEKILEVRSGIAPL